MLHHTYVGQHVGLPKWVPLHTTCMLPKWVPLHDLHAAVGIQHAYAARFNMPLPLCGAALTAALSLLIVGFSNLHGQIVYPILLLGSTHPTGILVFPCVHATQHHHQ